MLLPPDGIILTVDVDVTVVEYDTVTLELVLLGLRLRDGVDDECVLTLPLLLLTIPILPDALIDGVDDSTLTLDVEVTVVELDTLSLAPPALPLGDDVLTALTLLDALVDDVVEGRKVLTLADADWLKLALVALDGAELEVALTLGELDASAL